MNYTYKIKPKFVIRNDSDPLTTYLCTVEGDIHYTVNLFLVKQFSTYEEAYEFIKSNRLIHMSICSAKYECHVEDC